MVYAKYAHIFRLNQALKQDKLDQILKISKKNIDFITPELLEKDEQGKFLLRTRSLQTKKKNYPCWMLNFFQKQFQSKMMTRILCSRRFWKRPQEK